MISSEELKEIIITPIVDGIFEGVLILIQALTPYIIILIVGGIIGFIIKKLIYFYCTVTGTNKRETRKRIKLWNSIVDLFLNIVDLFKNDK